MKIGTLVKLGVGLATVLILTIGGTLFAASRAIDYATAQNQAAAEIVFANGRLQFLLVEYFLSRDPAAKAQWLSQYQSLTRLWADNDFAESSVAGEMVSMRLEHQRQLATFLRLADMFDAERRSAADASRWREQEAPLLRAIMQASQRLIVDGTRLAHATDAEMAKVQRRASLVATLLVALLGVAMAAGMAVIFRRVLAPIRRLQQSVAMIGAGDLDYRIDIDSHDELGELSRAFEHMTVQLRQSRQDLVAQTAKAAQAGYARSLIEASLDPLVAISEQGKITDANHATEEATGLSRQQLIGTDFVDYFTEPGKALAGYRQVSEKGFVRDFPLSLHHRSGRNIDVLYNATLYRDLTGQVQGIFAAARDITELKRVQQQLSRLNVELEQRVTERTAQLEEANQELEAFSYSVSHDLRTPLRAIDGFSLKLLKKYDEQLDDEGKRLLSVVRDNTSRMSQLIDDMLSFSRVGRSELQSVEVDLAGLFREAWPELSAAAGRELRLEIREMPPAVGDAAMLRQVAANLLSNAIKFTRPRDVARIEVGGSREGMECVYYVKDNGVGFDMRYVDKLFGVFQRLHGVNEFDGTGIGLAIVKRIIARLGGRVWAEGRVDEGATLHFTLPAKEAWHEPNS